MFASTHRADYNDIQCKTIDGLTSVLSDFFEMRHIDVLVRKIAKHFLSALQRKERDIISCFSEL